MSNDLVESVQCGSPNCDYQFPECRAAFNAPRRPCPKCGSTIRRASVVATATLAGTATLSGKAFRTSKSKWFAKFYDRQELYRLTGRFHRVRRMFNKRTDQYDEVIVDAETGELLRDVHEPLSKHQGHGSAKRHGS